MRIKFQDANIVLNACTINIIANILGFFTAPNGNRTHSWFTGVRVSSPCPCTWGICLLRNNNRIRLCSRNCLLLLFHGIRGMCLCHHRPDISCLSDQTNPGLPLRFLPVTTGKNHLSTHRQSHTLIAWPQLHSLRLYRCRNRKSCRKICRYRCKRGKRPCLAQTKKPFRHYRFCRHPLSGLALAVYHVHAKNCPYKTSSATRQIPTRRRCRHRGNCSKLCPRRCNSSTAIDVMS